MRCEGSRRCASGGRGRRRCCARRSPGVCARRGSQPTTASDGTEALAAAGRGPAPGSLRRARHRPAGRRRPRRLPGAAGARHHAPVLFLTALDAVHRPALRVQRRRRRLPDEAVRRSRSCWSGSTRCSGAAAPVPRPRRGLRLDPVEHAMRRRRRRVPLTPTEFRLLAALAAARGGRPAARARRARRWPDGAIVTENTLDSYIGRLRRKLRSSSARCAWRRCAASGTRCGEAGASGGRAPASLVTLARRLVGGATAVSTCCVARPARRRRRSVLGDARPPLETGHGRRPPRPRRVRRGAREPGARRAGLGLRRSGRLVEARPGSAAGAACRDAPRRRHAPSRLQRAASRVRLARRAAARAERRADRSSWSRVSLGPYERTETRALLGLASCSRCWSRRWRARRLAATVGRALRPVARMTVRPRSGASTTSTAASASASRRDELTWLAATLDGLLDRVAAALRHEQRFSAELSARAAHPARRDRGRGRTRAAPPSAEAHEYREALGADLPQDASSSPRSSRRCCRRAPGDDPVRAPDRPRRRRSSPQPRR